MTSGEALFYAVGAAVSGIFVLVGWRLFRELRWLIKTTPSQERDWTGVAIVLAMMLFGMFIGVGFGAIDLPIGRALRDLVNGS